MKAIDTPAKRAGTPPGADLPGINLNNQDRAFIQRVAMRIHKTGLVTPAVFFLEMTKPLSLIGSHAMVFFGPIVNAFINAEGYYRAAELLEDPGNVEFLIQEIERLDRTSAHEPSGENMEKQQ
jgi:hypothetical protein